MIKECFSNHFDFRFHLKKSFQESMSSQLQAMLNKFSIPEMMATFALNSLKNFEKIEGGDEKKLEEFFEILVSLLGCLEEKDKFLHFFSKKFSSRLLNGGFGSGFSGLYWDSYFIRTIKSQVNLKIFFKTFFKKFSKNNFQIFFDNFTSLEVNSQKISKQCSEKSKRVSKTSQTGKYTSRT